MKAKEVKLMHGVRLVKEGIAPVTEHLTPYVLHLLEPVDGIESIQVQPNTLGQVLAIHEKVSDDYRIGTQQYQDAVFVENVARRCSPALNKQQLDRLSGPDHDFLMRLMDRGVDPDTGVNAWRLRDGAEVERRATIRLHDMNDRKIAEQRLPGDVADDPIRYNAYLLWYITRFGSPDFDGAPKVTFASFLNLTWNDFQLLYAELYMRDYRPLTDILEAKMEVGGKPVPFPGVAEDDTDAPAPRSTRGRGKSN